MLIVCGELAGNLRILLSASYSKPDLLFRFLSTQPKARRVHVQLLCKYLNIKRCKEQRCREQYDASGKMATRASRIATAVWDPGAFQALDGEKGGIFVPPALRRGWPLILGYRNIVPHWTAPGVFGINEEAVRPE